MKSILKAIAYLLIGILIGLNLSELKTDKVISTINKTEYHSSQIEFYDNMIKDINVIEVYDTSELTPQIMANRNGKIIFAEDIFQEVSKEQAGKTHLQGHQQREEVQHRCLRHKHCQQVQGRGEVVGKQAQIIQTHTNIPIVQQTVSVQQCLTEGFEEGEILVVVVRVKHRILTEGVAFCAIHIDQHTDQRKQKSQQQVQPTVVGLGLGR